MNTNHVLKYKGIVKYINTKFLRFYKSPITGKIIKVEFYHDVNVSIDVLNQQFKLLTMYASRIDGKELKELNDKLDKLIMLISSNKLEILKLGIILFDNIMSQYLGYKSIK